MGLARSWRPITGAQAEAVETPAGSVIADEYVTVAQLCAAPYAAACKAAGITG
jgi:hypothetical protein